MKGLLALVLFNLALTPCALAIDAGQGDCPHCPPAEQAAMSMHDGHHDRTAAPDCATVQAECCDLSAVSVGSRSGAVEPKDLPDRDAAPAPAPAGIPVGQGTAAAVVADAPDPPDERRPRHKLFCVYLD